MLSRGLNLRVEPRDNGPTLPVPKIKRPRQTLFSLKPLAEDSCYEDQVLLVQEAASVLLVRTEGLESIVTVDSKQNGA